jgi:ferredoxin
MAQTQTLEIPGDQYILEAAEEANVSLPYDCRLGSCVTCGGKIESGTVDQTDQIFLSDELMDQVKAQTRDSG